MSGTTGTIPLQSAIPQQLITSALWGQEFDNIAALLDAAGAGGHSDTDSDAQIQTNPYPGSVLSKAASIAGELERLRYAIAQMKGKTYWYQPSDSDIATMFNSLVPVGACIDYPTNTAPNANFHLADGTAISRAGFPTLFTLIGTTFGIGDGTTTFNLPDYRDRMSIGAGTTYAAGAKGGAATHTLTASEIPSSGLTVPITDPGHTHSITDPTHAHGLTDPGHVHSMVPRVQTGGGSTFASTNTANGTTAQNTGSAVTGATINSASTGITGANSNTTGITAALAGGGGAAHSILNPYLSMYKMVRVL